MSHTPALATTTAIAFHARAVRRTAPARRGNAPLELEIVGKDRGVNEWQVIGPAVRL
jgi:hypothetical protein